MPLMIRYRATNHQICLETTIIGRAPSCHLVVQGWGVSRRHCCLHRVRDAVFVRDLDSENGTRVNGKRIPREGVKLAPGDVLRLGETELRVFAQEGAGLRDAVLGSPIIRFSEEASPVTSTIPVPRSSARSPASSSAMLPVVEISAVDEVTD